MRKTKWRLVAAVLAVCLLTLEIVPLASSSVITGCVAGQPGVISTFSYTGAEQCYTVPTGVSTIHVVAAGAPGGYVGFSGPAHDSGRGAIVTGDVTVPPGVSTLYVEVGGTAAGPEAPGFNGGGVGNLSGGGASDVRTCSTISLISSSTCRLTGQAGDPRLIVAGGGGGTPNNEAAHGGDAGFNGASGDGLQPGQGGSQTSGGGGFQSGGPGAGGSGRGLGGAGGGGWWGGGSASDNSSGGGGGSSYAPIGASFGATDEPPQVTILPYATSSAGPSGSQGPAGAQGATGNGGPTGPQGPPGAPASILFVTVGPTGKLTAGPHGATARRVRKGFYDVSFPGDRMGCAPAAVPTDGLRLARQPGRPAAEPFIAPSSISFNAGFTTIGFAEADAAGKSGGPIQPGNVPFNVYLMCPPA